MIYTQFCSSHQTLPFTHGMCGVNAYNIIIYINYCKCYVVCNVSHLLDLNHCNAKCVGMKVGKCIKILTIYPFIICILSRTKQKINLKKIKRFNKQGIQ
jgi:hypothetical protein